MILRDNKSSAQRREGLQIRVQKGFFTSVIGLTILGILFGVFLIAGGVFTYYYIKYSRMIDARLSGNILQNTTQIFSAPEHVSAAQAWGPEDLTGYLTRVGYRPEQDPNSLGQFTVQGSTVDIRPSKLSYFAGNNALAVQFRGKAIRTIRPLAGGPELDSAEIEPELITNRSEEHTSELQSPCNLVCRLLLEKKKKKES